MILRVCELRPPEAAGIPGEARKEGDEAQQSPGTRSAVADKHTWTQTPSTEFMFNLDVDRSTKLLLGPHTDMLLQPEWFKRHHILSQAQKPHFSSLPPKSFPGPFPLTTPRRTEHLPSTQTDQRKGKTKAFEEGKSTHQQPLQNPQLLNLLCTCHIYPDSSGSKLKFLSGWWEEGRHRAGCSFHTLLTTYQVLKNPYSLV